MTSTSPRITARVDADTQNLLSKKLKDSYSLAGHI